MITISKGFLIATAVTLIFSLKVNAMTGPGSGNGGDMCEDRIKTIRDDIQSWIVKGGAANLQLPQGLDHLNYLVRMTTALSHASVGCTDQTIYVGSEEKACRNTIDTAGNGRIVCNVKRFQETTESDQYVLIHHEYAGLSGLETNDGDGSKYMISNQISGYLESTMVKKLVIRPSSQAKSFRCFAAYGTGTNIYDFKWKVVAMIPSAASTPGAAYYGAQIYDFGFTVGFESASSAFFQYSIVKGAQIHKSPDGSMTMSSEFESDGYLPRSGGNVSFGFQNHLVQITCK